MKLRIFFLIFLLCCGLVEGISAIVLETEWLRPRQWDFFSENKMKVRTPIKISEAEVFWKKSNSNFFSDDQLKRFQTEGIDHSEDVLPTRLELGVRLPLPDMIYKAKAKSSISHELLYDVTYSTDHTGRRRVQQHQASASQCVVFIGDSFTFGEGVSDSQNFPFYFNQRDPHVLVWNLGIPGAGPADILRLLETKSEFMNPIVPGCIVVYTFISDHLRRVVLDSSAFEKGNEWYLEKPFYQLVDGHIVFRGSQAGRGGYLSFLKAFSKIHFFRLMSLRWPLQATGEGDKIFTGVVAKIVELVKERGAKFIFSIHPQSDLLSKSLADELEFRKIQPVALELNQGTDWAPSQLTFPMDGHPTPAGHEIYAALLLHYLGLGGK